MLLIRLVLLPVRIGVGTTRLGIRTAYRAGRLAGYRRLFVFAAGVGVGVVVAPTAGAETRARIRAALEDRRAPAAQDLAERVRFELSHAPRTWHLPQPSVEVLGQRAVLRGQVPHETGRMDLERTAAAVSGITGVDNQVVVTDGPGTA